jgi:hypothetical protein
MTNSQSSAAAETPWRTTFADQSAYLSASVAASSRAVDLASKTSTRRCQHAKEVLDKTLHVHTVESFLWAALHSGHMGQFIEQIPYVASQIACQITTAVRPIPSNPQLAVKELIDWDTIHLTPLYTKLERLFESPHMWPPPQEAFDFRFHVEPPETGRRSYLWFAMVKGDRIPSSPPSMNFTVNVYNVDVTDLPSLRRSAQGDRTSKASPKSSVWTAALAPA